MKRPPPNCAREETKLPFCGSNPFRLTSICFALLEFIPNAVRLLKANDPKKKNKKGEKGDSGSAQIFPMYSNLNRSFFLFFFYS